MYNCFICLLRSQSTHTFSFMAGDGFFSVMATFFSADGLRCLQCFLGEFIAIGEGNQLGVDTVVVMFFFGDLVLGSIFRAVILLRVGVNDLVRG